MVVLQHCSLALACFSYPESFVVPYEILNNFPLFPISVKNEVEILLRTALNQ